MRCLACNKALNDYEATRKSASSGEYLDLCNGCFHNIDHEVQAVSRSDLLDDEDVFDSDLEPDNLTGDLFDCIKE